MSVTQVFDDVARNFQAIGLSDYPAQVQTAIDLLLKQFRAGNTLLVCGNGGSAADAMHICAELVGRFQMDRGPIAAIALTANPAVLTAWSNDFSYETVFARQVEALAKPGDVVWGISTSGNSTNVVEALKAAHSMNALTIGLTGKGGGAMAPYSDVLLAVPLSSTPRVQEVHLATYHAICEAVEAALCKAPHHLEHSVKSNAE